MNPMGVYLQAWARRQEADLWLTSWLIDWIFWMDDHCLAWMTPVMDLGLEAGRKRLKDNNMGGWGLP